jgi:formate hydrogenlyase subunit 3/multisubunit Na+/H+ antiporter MnhD subunit
LFSGFASKWTIFTAMVQGSHQAGYLAVLAAIGILTSALTLATFVKFYGTSFLCRSSALVKAKVAAPGRLEVGAIMQAPQVLLALICLLLGVFPAIGFALVQRVLAATPDGMGGALGEAASGPTGWWTGIAGLDSHAVFAPLAVVLLIGAALVAAGFIARLGGASRRASTPWLCGYAREEEANRYVAHGFYGEIKRYFRWVGGAPSTHPPKPAVVKEH